MTETPEKAKRTRQSKKEHIPCYVHDKCDNHKFIHHKVCQGQKLQTTKHTDNEYYCILHLPTKEKDTDEFNQIFRERIIEIDNEVTKIEADYANDENRQKVEIEKLEYNSRYVWFPKEI